MTMNDKQKACRHFRRQAFLGANESATFTQRDA